MTSSRLIDPQTAVVAADGTCTFTFRPPPSGTVATGVVSVTTDQTAVVPALWLVRLGGVTVTTAQGGNSAQIQMVAGEPMTVVGAGLNPGDVYEATFAAVVSDARVTAQQPPMASPQSYHIPAPPKVVTATLPAGSVRGTDATFTWVYPLNQSPAATVVENLKLKWKGTITGTGASGSFNARFGLWPYNTFTEPEVVDSTTVPSATSTFATQGGSGSSYSTTFTVPSHVLANSGQVAATFNWTGAGSYFNTCTYTASSASATLP